MALDAKKVLPFERVAGRVRAMISAGEFRSGARMPSEQTLAKEFNVCRMTVNRALKQLETEGLVYPRRGVGRFVGKSRRVRHKRIGVAIYDIGHAANPAMAEVLGGLRETIRAAGYDMIIYASEESHRHVGDAQLMSSVYASVVDAVVVLHQSIERSHLEQISQEVPMLVVNLPAAGLPVHRVETDLAGGGSWWGVDFRSWDIDRLR